MAFILKPVEKDCVCLVSGKRHIAHERTEMSVLVSGKRQIAHEVSKMSVLVSGKRHIAHESLMSVEDSASDATGSSADSATGLTLQLTLQPVWFFGRLGDRIGASSSLATCLALQLTR